MTLRYLSPSEFPQVEPPLEAMSVEGDYTPARVHVAIIGSREALPTTIPIARRLAQIVVEAGGVVISGGANGTDAAAHQGAIDAGGRTWAVLGCGAPNVTPSARCDDKERFPRILATGGALIRPFPHETRATPPLFLSRNRVTVALSEIVVVVQAAADSGTSSAAGHARRMGKEIWVVPGFGAEFAASWALADRGARVMRSEAEFAKRLATATPELADEPRAVLETLTSRAKHPDEIAAETGLSTSAVATALLTLALADVVVEGSAGLFQRK